MQQTKHSALTASRVLHETMRIAGEHIDNPRRIEVFNPYTEQLIGTVPQATPADIKHALQRAKAFRSKLSRYDRSQILKRTAEILDSRREAISDLITAESGLCKKDTLYEVGRACDVFQFASMLSLVDDAQTFSCDISPQGKARRIFTQREPLIGAITAITPFNHPLNQVAHKVAPSIATNNRMVLKPSEKTPLTALLLADILYEAGLPPAMFSVVTGQPAEISETLLTDASVDLVTFTGGVAIGKSIAQRAGYRRMVLELGGNDPLIVMDDVCTEADLDKAATLAASGSYKNSGQRCTAVKRILVHEAVADRFVALLVEKTRALHYGDPTDPHTEMGTVIDDAAARYCEDAVNDAVQKGAKVLIGHERRGALYAPTVVDHVPRDAYLVMQETFGPVSPILRFKDLNDAITLVNSTAYGLSSGLCTHRLETITQVINELHVGTVNVWEVPGYRIEMSPFGGIKDSGLGYKEGVLEAMKSFTNLKTYSLPWMS